MYELKVEGAFEAAHQIPNYPGKCARLHGHNWVVEATVKGTELDELGMLVDFKAVKKELGTVLDAFDHRFLNDLAPFSQGVNPTAENLAHIIFERLAASSIFPEGEGRAYLASVTVWESPKSSVTYSAS
ncbi:MAG: 6-carboxytetrahydropterin synthase QueD [Selenomonas sp.]|uniref:6-carboxytetrahydropterin synthase QueD n=1 Tax=Selenomonas sp. TaxID=2053611 RepID=UPI0025F82C24|nr:6-carboxytetrahydropterin synthase QueD [Selenomonas sp.]MCI6101215.1 6-carboxytetrahydropterin synthase QueD [Selenomonas sp.]MCI6231101.1 6-carboxytetrahydropterin synthase QueD [Selenomonas sp.]